jgi:hypothetical protein
MGSEAKPEDITIGRMRRTCRYSHGLLQPQPGLFALVGCGPDMRTQEPAAAFLLKVWRCPQRDHVELSDDGVQPLAVPPATQRGGSII